MNDNLEDNFKDMLRGFGAIFKNTDEPSLRALGTFFELEEKFTIIRDKLGTPDCEEEFSKNANNFFEQLKILAEDFIKEYVEEEK